MEAEQAIRARRTQKVFAAEPVDAATLNELFELARWAPNHKLTNPWRFRVVGQQALARLMEAEGDAIKAKKLLRAPTLVAVTASSPADATETTRRENLLAAGCAAYIVLLGATDRGLASYWRTPWVLTTEAGRAALGIEPNEQVVGLLHLGMPRQPARMTERLPVEQVVEFLD